LDIVEKFVTSRSCRKSLHDASLRKIPDFEKICQKCDGARVTLADLFKAYSGIIEVGNIIKILSDEFQEEQTDIVTTVFVAPLRDRQKELKMFVARMQKTLDFEAVENGEYRVSGSFNETLSGLQQEIDTVKEKLYSQSKREADRLGMNPKTLKLECSSQHGYYFRVTYKEEKSLRQKGLIVFDSTKQV
jgi:DNA mismatch repair protein MSH2